MNDKNIPILGVCRFSMLGRGDWKAYRGKSDEDLAAIYEQKVQELFEPSRMENRLATFEHLTLRSMKFQTDQYFTFLVVSSDRMPLEYRNRLENICAEVGQVVLRFVSPMHISEAIREYATETKHDMPNIVQFRLDDDDSVSKDYIRRLRRHATDMWRNANFAVSFPNIFYCVTDGPTSGIYRWFSPFFSAGTAVRHNNRTVFDFGHYKIPQHIVAVTDPHFPCIVTHSGYNDTPRHEAQILRKRGMIRADKLSIIQSINRHFGFLREDGMRIATLPIPKELLNPDNS